MNLQDKRVVVVEDEAIIALDCAQALIDLGLSVVAVCANAKDASAAIRKHVPDLVLLDINLNGALSGIDVGRGIQTAYPGTAIIFCSGDLDAVEAVASADLKSAALILKPFSRDQLQKLALGILQKP